MQLGRPGHLAGLIVGPVPPWQDVFRDGQFVVMVPDRSLRILNIRI